MKLIHALVVLVVSVVGCGKQSDSPNAKTSTPAAGQTVMIDSKNLLFSTPTLNNAIPSTVDGSTVPSGCIQFHEDDWRQFEFVPASLKDKVDAELVDIGAIWKDSSVPLGEMGHAFRSIHVRERIPLALNIPMSLAEFEAFVGQKTGPMTFLGYDKVLRDVHAVKIDNLIVYAEIHDDKVVTMGFDAFDQFQLSREFFDRLDQFVQDNKVMLVHWRSRTLFDNRNDVMKYFGTVEE